MMRRMWQTIERFGIAALAAAAMLSAPATARADQKSLLTPDGTLYHVESGYYSAFEPNGTAARPDDYVIEWTATPQAGSVSSGTVPGTASPDLKDQFDLAYDSVSQTLFLVWSNRFSMVNSVQFAILQRGIWTQSELLPSAVFTFAQNPRLLITHQTVRMLAPNGREQDYQRSIVSIIWWEESVHPRARYAPIFIENNGIDLADVQIFDLPELAGLTSRGIAGNAVLDETQGAIYQNPSLQADGLSSTILATFADPGSERFATVHIDFPSDLRINPHGRGHVIVILKTDDRPKPMAVPASPTLIGTTVGSGYHPTVYWQSDPGSVQFTVFDGSAWGDARTVPLTGGLTTNAAIVLIRAMAAQN
jgi:hypothetical protein